MLQLIESNRSTKYYTFFPAPRCVIYVCDATFHRNEGKIDR
jgi:hypothetical protein